MIINAFKEKIFPLSPEESLFEDEDVHRGDEDTNENQNNLDDLDKAVVINDEMIDKELFKQYFDYESLNKMLEDLYTKEGTSSNKTTADMIRNKLSNFSRNVIRMTPGEIAAKRLFKIMNTVARILDFNKQSQEGKGLKILTPQQMLTRLPIFLVQIKAGNNSPKLKNEIRQLLYSLYRSKKLRKHFMNAI